LLVLVFKDIGKSLQSCSKILDKIGAKTEGITNALKGSVDGLVDVGADKITVENEGSPEMAAHSSTTFDEERKRCARNRRWKRIR
jgi:hypothetical protein